RPSRRLRTGPGPHRDARARRLARRLAHRRPRRARLRGPGPAPREGRGREGTGGAAVIRVLLADDQPLMRGGFRALIDAEDDMTVVAEAADGPAAVELALARRPD